MRKSCIVTLLLVCGCASPAGTSYLPLTATDEHEIAPVSEITTQLLRVLPETYAGCMDDWRIEITNDSLATHGCLATNTGCTNPASRTIWISCTQDWQGSNDLLTHELTHAAIWCSGWGGRSVDPGHRAAQLWRTSTPADAVSLQDKIVGSLPAPTEHGWLFQACQALAKEGHSGL